MPKIRVRPFEFDRNFVRAPFPTYRERVTSGWATGEARGEAETVETTLISIAKSASSDFAELQRSVDAAQTLNKEGLFFSTQKNFQIVQFLYCEPFPTYRERVTSGWATGEARGEAETVETTLISIAKSASSDFAELQRSVDAAQTLNKENLFFSTQKNFQIVQFLYSDEHWETDVRDPSSRSGQRTR